LEGAPQNWNTYIPEPAMVWSTITTGSISAGGTAIGTGYKNTLAITGRGAGTSPAGERVRAYQGVGPVPVSDWYMASIDELQAMWNSVGHLSFFSYTYSSSSEELDSIFSRYNVLYYSQGGGGNRSSFPKVASGSPNMMVVKPVRAFSAIELTYTPRTISFDNSASSSSYSIIDSAPTLVTSISAGSGSKTYSTSTPAVCAINSLSGAISFVSAGSCTISASVADDGTYAAATNTFIFTVTKASPAIAFELSDGTKSLIYRTPNTITLTSTTAGKISLRANGKAVSGCINLTIAVTRTCTFKPSSHGQVSLQVIFTPTNAASYAATSTSIIYIPVQNRINPR
jgi:hypothetical protein